MRKPSPIQISIPTPCHEDWDKMTDSTQGKYCASCCKTVTDFSSYTDAQLHRYFILHKDEQFCGRFRASQLNRNINISHQPQSRLYHYFVGLGLTLLITAAPMQQLSAKAPYAFCHPFDDPQPQPDSSSTSCTFSGHVFDFMKEPVLSATIQIYKDGVLKGGAVTDEDGFFKIFPLQPGNYTVQTSCLAYKTDTGTVTLQSGQNTMNIQLKLGDPELEHVMVSGLMMPLFSDRDIQTASPSKFTRKQKSKDKKHK